MLSINCKRKALATRRSTRNVNVAVKVGNPSLQAGCFQSASAQGAFFALSMPSGERRGPVLKSVWQKLHSC